jgi:hypothetical protein
VIEIRIKAASDTDAAYAAETAKAAAAGRDASAAYSSAVASHLRTEGGADIAQSLSASLAGATSSVRGDAGGEIADEIVDSISDTIGKDLPPKIQDPIKKSGTVSGTVFSSAFQGQLSQGLSSSGVAGMAQQQGQKFSVSFGQGAKTGIADANLAGIVGDALGDGLADAVPDDVLAPDSPAGEKIRENSKKTGEAAGKDMGDAISPLLTTAIVGGLSAGAPLILGAFGGIMAGVTALALKSNVVIAHDFAAIGSTAQAALTQAAAPAAGTLHQALMSVETTVQNLTPQLKGMFVNAEPDITAVASGIGAFATNILPGMSAALANSQGIVADLGQALGSLGSGVGGMFEGLTRDAYTTGAGMESLLGTVGHLASTLGSVLGSAASVGSTALMGLDPVLNTTLSLVQKIASPGVVGAGAGLFAAFKLDSSISGGLKSAADGVSTLALKSMDAEGVFGKMSGALAGTSSALEKGASVMSGPWGLAIGAGVGLVTGLVGSLINASHASDALTLSQQGLQQAVAQDQGTIGTATAAYVAAQAQADGLAKSAADAGVSLETWTQAVIGNKNAQAAVTAAVNTTNQIIQNQKAATDDAARSSGKFSGELQDATTSAQDAAAANNTLTGQNQQLINSMHAQTQQITQAVQKQADLTEATNILTNSTDIFGASLNASYQQLVSSSQQSALNTVAAMNLGDANVDLSQRLYNSVSAYSQATAAAQGYSAVLTSLNGTTMSVDQAQNTLAQQMIEAKKSFKQNNESLDLSTQAGVKNREALVSAAQAIQALGDAEYQKTGSITDANAAMKKQEDAFIAATGATGKAKTAIEQYIDQLLKIPSSETTTITQVYTTKGGEVRSTGSGARGAYAMGGVVSTAATGGNRGGLVQIHEHGTELVRLQNGSTVIPHANVESMAATGQLGGQIGNVGLEVSFGGDLDGAFATYFMKLVRDGKIQIKQKAIVR